MDLATSSPFSCQQSPQAQVFKGVAQLATYKLIEKCQQKFEKHHCAALRDSLDTDDRDKIIRCDSHDLCDDASDESLNILSGCSKGGIDFALNKVTAIITLSKAFMAGMEEEKRCSTGPDSIERKKTLYAVYDFSVAPAMRLKIPSDDDLSRQLCGEIIERLNTTYAENMRQLTGEAELKEHLNLPLSPELQEFMAWRKDKIANKKMTTNEALMKKVQEFIHTQISNFKCYNQQAKTEMICEAAANVIWVAVTKVVPVVFAEKKMINMAVEAEAKAATSATKALTPAEFPPPSE